MQTLTFLIFTVSAKISTLKFLPHMDTDHYVDSHFSWKSISILTISKSSNTHIPYECAKSLVHLLPAKANSMEVHVCNVSKNKCLELMSCLSINPKTNQYKWMTKKKEKKKRPQHTLFVYTWQIMCSCGLMSLGLRVIQMPRPWDPDSGFRMYVLFFFWRVYAWKSP